SMSSQAMLLRVLQESKFERVGGEKVLEVDVRLIAATNVDLKDAVMKGDFRKDLYFRVAVMFFGLTPLYERGRDVVLLTNHFIRKFGRDIGKEHVRLTSDAEEALLGYTWPGNVRELENTIERAVVIAPGDEITKECLRTEISDPKSVVSSHHDGASNAVVGDIGRGINFYEEVRRFEIDLIRRALEQTGGHQSRAARLLGMNATTLNSKIKTYNINLRP
ncbi:MAG TPA: sigma 54-interacting transcriptional regulator, partial [Pyrinomonadaceae bacterium]|nr:sigma 54-interacting transcriptional regulator [Pyrinomonadaceae bacterium]